MRPISSVQFCTHESRMWKIFLASPKGIFRARSFGSWSRDCLVADDGADGASREGFHRQAGIEGGRE